MAQENPECPKCKTNRRVIASHKSTRRGLIDLVSFSLPSMQEYFKCNNCKEEFLGIRS